jgi:hypothetical protein
MKLKSCFLFGFFCLCGRVFAQETLPAVSVNGSNKRVVVSWLNDYQKPIESILIQRSYDSLINFRSIGSVLNPLNLENGFLDQQPPYDRMYYRVFIQFSGGEYVIGPSARARFDAETMEPLDIRQDSILENQELPTAWKRVRKDIAFFSPFIKKQAPKVNLPTPELILTDTLTETNNTEELSFQFKNRNILSIDSSKSSVRIVEPSTPLKMTPVQPVPSFEKKPLIRTTYPSTRIFTNNTQTIMIDLRGYAHENIRIVFYDEQGNQILNIDGVPEPLLYLERYNFRKSGWYNFEVYEQSILVEKSKVFIAKDKGIPSSRR